MVLSAERRGSLFVQPEDPIAGLLQAAEGLDEIADLYPGDQLQGAGGRLGKGAVLGRAVAGGGDHCQRTKGRSGAQDGPAVLRIGDLVQGQQDPATSVWSGRLIAFCRDSQ